MYEKERGVMIPEPGNLLVMARLNFRVKCNNHFRDSAPLGRCLLFYESRHFFMECACSYELYMIKWQAILLRIHSFPPRTHERIIFLPRGGIATSFFIGKNYVWLCQERRKEPWRNHTGKAKNTLTSATKTVSIFRAIKEQIRRILIVCSAIALYMHWEINVVVISALRKAGSKTAPNASFLTEEKISDMLQVNIASLRKLYGSSGKNKKQASSDTGKCIFLCLNWPVLFGVDNICYLSEKIQKIILWFGEKP
jgi:hypothetical protein